jgi:molybdopterin synthase catalytic subunit
VKIRLVAFASAADALNAREFSLELPAGSRVSDLLDHLASENPGFDQLRGRLAVAIGGRLASSDTELEGDLEVALLPPVSGGNREPRVRFVRDAIDLGDLLARIASPECGAQVAFVGRVRHRRMAREALEQICSQLEATTPDLRIGITHRLGDVPVAEATVVIVATSPHRGAAFGASREALERLKREVPIWKKEHYADGSAAWREEEPLTGVLDRVW